MRSREIKDFNKCKLLASQGKYSRYFWDDQSYLAWLTDPKVGNKNYKRFFPKDPPSTYAPWSEAWKGYEDFLNIVDMAKGKGNKGKILWDDFSKYIPWNVCMML